jgi:hypothetical protein
VAVVVRVGVRATLAADQTSGFESASLVRTERATESEWVADPTPIVIDVLQFAELDSGERVTAGDIRLEAAYRDAALLEEDLRSFVVEEPEMAAIKREEEGDDYEPELQSLVDALAERGIETDADTLAALPLVVEVDDAVRSRFD